MPECPSRNPLDAAEPGSDRAKAARLSRRACSPKPPWQLRGHLKRLRSLSEPSSYRNQAQSSIWCSSIKIFVKAGRFEHHIFEAGAFHRIKQAPCIAERAEDCRHG